VTSEADFSTSHSSFWNALLPMADSYVRAQNENLHSFAVPARSLAPAEQRGVVNEAAFLMFEEAVRVSAPPHMLPSSAMSGFISRAVEYVRRFRNPTQVLLEDLSPIAEWEAISIAARLFTFFAEEMNETSESVGIVVRPPFPGCGWLDRAEGDALSGSTLYEIKSGERHFRVADFRQVLCYCALDHGSHSYGIDKIVVLNPRAGKFIREDLSSLCYKISGMSPPDLLGEIVNYVSEPLSRYQAP
jgi:hypothetical protein